MALAMGFCSLNDQLFTGVESPKPPSTLPIKACGVPSKAAFTVTLGK